MSFSFAFKTALAFRILRDIRDVLLTSEKLWIGIVVLTLCVLVVKVTSSCTLDALMCADDLRDTIESKVKEVM